jgi:Meiotically up-regulated gene 113
LHRLCASVNMKGVLRPDDPDVATVLTRPASGWLYAIAAPEVRRVKIGHAQDVAKRLLLFQTGSPTELMLHSATLEDNVVVAEARAHAALAHARLTGEWFDLCDREVDRWLARREADVAANGVHDRYLAETGSAFRGFQVMGDR